MKTRQEQEALEEFIEKQRRLEEYKVRCIKDEEREENRQELHRLIGPFDPINIAEDGTMVGSGQLVDRNNGSQVLFSDERGRRKSKGDTTKTTPRAEFGNRSKSAENQGRGRGRSKSGERSSYLETKSKPFSTLNSQNLTKQGGSRDSLTNASKRPVPAPRNGRKLSNTSQSGSKEKLPNSRYGSRESLKSSNDLNRSGSRDDDGAKQSRQGREQINRNASKVKPEWNSSEKMEYTKPSKSELPARSRSAEGKTKKVVAAPRSSSLEKEKKKPGEGDDRRGSVASLYVYRGSVSSECDVPLAYSRSRSKVDDEEDVCEDDLIQSLMGTDEGRSALAEGRPLSREGRRRLQGSTRGEGICGNDNQTQSSQLMAKQTTKMSTKQNGGNMNTPKATGTIESPEVGKTTNSAKGSSTNKGSSGQGSSGQGPSLGNKDQIATNSRQELQQAKGSTTTVNKDQKQTTRKGQQQQQQRGEGKKALIEEESMLMAVQESKMENSPDMNFDDAEQNTKHDASNAKGLSLCIFIIVKKIKVKLVKVKSSAKHKKNRI